jgi:hypothetical protein
VDFQTPTGRMLFTQLQSLAQYQRENARYEWAGRADTGVGARRVARAAAGRAT